MRSAEIGATRVWLRGDPEAYSLHPKHYGDLKLALLFGCSPARKGDVGEIAINCPVYFEATDCYGDEILIRLSDIVAVLRATPEAFAEALRDAKIDDITESL